jgi:hypothetical protein
MATLGGTFITLVDLAKREDPDGTPAEIAETLTQQNSALEDMPWIESNMRTAHRSTIRVGLPTIATRRFNEGVVPSKSTTDQIVDGIARLEGQSFIDVDLLANTGDPAATRKEEGSSFVEAMSQTQGELLFYGSEADDSSEYNGFGVRYTALSDQQVLDATASPFTSGAATNDYSSIWLIIWAPGKVFGIYPRGSVGGMRHKDLGEMMVNVDTGAAAAQGLGTPKMLAHGDQYKWDCGLVCKDRRYVVRIANVSVSDAKALNFSQQLTEYGTAINYLMMEALHIPPSLEGGRAVFYMNRGLCAAFDKMSMAGANTNVYRTEDYNGRMVMSFRGIPIKKMDQLIVGEAAVA